MAKVLRLTAGKGFTKPKTKKGGSGAKESLLQSALFEWAEWGVSRWPEVRWMFAVPNGFPLHGTQRFAVVNWMKAQGLKPGVPDIFLPAARPPFHGLFIEMKTPDGELSLQQCDWHFALIEAEYMVATCRSTQEAIDTIVDYLER